MQSDRIVVYNVAWNDMHIIDRIRLLRSGLMKKQVTIKDIAKAAGVTPSTVSCILNKKPLPFKAETVKKVNQIAHEMGYTANVLARGW